ncbi:MAG: nitrate/nitrite transporter [Candidatus Heimdallarchaeota archaeon]
MNQQANFSQDPIHETKGTPTIGLIGATLGFFIGFAAVVALGATAKFLKPEFKDIGISVFLIGLLVAMPNLSGSLLRIPFAAWSDSVGSRKSLLVLLVLSTFGMFGLVLVGIFIYPDFEQWHYPLLLFLGALAGCGIATFSVGISQTSYWYPQKEQGKALGIYAGLGNTAPGIFSLIMAIALAMSDEDLGVSYALWFVLLGIGTVLYYIMGLNAWSFQLMEKGVPPEEAKAKAEELGQELFPAHNLRQSLEVSGRVWQTWALVALYFTSFGGFIALAAWFPTYWNEFHSVGKMQIIGLDLKLSVALLLNAVFVIVGALTRVVSGSIADKITGELTTTGGLLVLLAGSIIMIIATEKSYDLAVVGMLIISVGMGIVNAGVFKMVPKAVPNAVGGAAGWIGGLGAFGGFVIPPIMGGFVDIYEDIGYAYGFVSFTILSIISLFVTRVLIKSKGSS